MESDADTISSDENSENSEIDKFDTVKDISEKAKGQEISEGNSGKIFMFWGQKSFNFFKNIVASALKSCIK